eukprot:TRINITY_DN2871_c0_g2_i1.p1 TRINITY_DN2871_c0_g2~~TRINITY_DN2871_c0_g2_i1.p1  ORF type:complete len:580 (-),score=150.59 TRINITY_DN2871_c0_g2_i1:105-1844(-)
MSDILQYDIANILEDDNFVNSFIYSTSSPPTLEGSSTDQSPILLDEPTTYHSSSDNSPSHWSQMNVPVGVLPHVPDLGINFNNETQHTDMMYYNPAEYQDFSYQTDIVTMSTIPSPPLNSMSPMSQPLLQQPPSTMMQTPLYPGAATPASVVGDNMCLNGDNVIKKTTMRSSKKRPRSDPSLLPTGEEVVLPRDTLLNITSQSMDNYVASLQNQRNLSQDEQKELKRQKRLIKNRESAQLSRERKRAYIDTLEAKIVELTNENLSLKQAIAQYQLQESAHKSESQNYNTKMGSLLTIGNNNRTAKAGVCLLIVLFSFGLFMNVNNTQTMMIGPAGTAMRYPLLSRSPSPPGSSSSVSIGDTSAIASLSSSFSPPSPSIATVGIKRSLMETLDDSESDDIVVPPPKYIKKESEQTEEIRATRTTATPNHTSTRKISRVDVKPAGIYKVSYSSEPANFLSSQEHVHESEEANKTYMLFLDPRPDLADEADVTVSTSSSSPSSSSSSSSSSHSTLQVQSYIKQEVAKTLPPMIINLVIPENIANGTNPLVLPAGSNAADSLMEVTCQVTDISITTTERTHRN